MPPEILLIDDDALASALRKRVLERKGYRVQLALDGYTGVALTDALNPALIVMDHRLPDLIGPILLQRLKELRPNTPVILHTDYEQANESYPQAPDAVLTKGDGVEIILRTIAEQLASREAA